MKEWTYEKAGVPHLKGDAAYNNKISKLIRSTHRSGVLGSPTGFASLFDLKKASFKSPLLVSSTDGVGTKLEIAHLQGNHKTIGIDLVAMCVNDIVTFGAQPLLFLDYFATGRFDSKATFDVLQGIVKGCREAGCALVGGETAIMPGFYEVKQAGGVPQYDLAGFSVGAVEKKKVVTGKEIRAGDVLLGLASSGFHSNGFSLLRKIFSVRELKGPIGKDLLKPTRIYVKPVLALQKTVRIKGIVNITGGGFIDNLPRVIPSHLAARVDATSWKPAKIFQKVQNSGNITAFEMMRTFNMGVGMVLILKKGQEKNAQMILRRYKIPSFVMGRVEKKKSKSSVIVEGVD